MVLEILCVEPIYPQYSGVLETCLALRYWFFEVLGSESVNAELDEMPHSIIVAKMPGPVVKKLFPCSTQLSTKFILLINVKMPTTVGNLTFISMINTTSERFNARKFCIFRYLIFKSSRNFMLS